VLPVGWLLFAVALAIVLTVWVMFTLTRLDRLHARVDAAWAALDAQLVRRTAALLASAESPDSGLDRQRRTAVESVVHTALAVSGDVERQEAENEVGRALTDLAATSASLPDSTRAELTDTANRVMIARRFYNDAVRDTRTLRARRMPRLLRLAGRRGMPQFFDIDDTVPPVAGH
jgi:hypothetical protein